MNKLKPIGDSISEQINNDNKTINAEYLLVKVDDHYEIREGYKNRLQQIDLRNVYLKNVYIAGLNFSNCKMNLFPQEVYKKDLRNCDFTGVHLTPFLNFSGVDIRGAKFSRDNDYRTEDIMPSFIGAIYDETTTYNGIPLTKLLNKQEEKHGRKIS